jgi:predicted Rossmann fold nucleotide-binding protein DprA/Smf involved in DNA uptake
MPPTEPFTKCRSTHPTWHHATIIKTVEIGVHSVDGLREETGIEIGTLHAVLAELESQMYLVRCRELYHRATGRRTIVPPPLEK